ncbi:MAG: hypothetical protein ACRD4V_03880 [Candidatus Acidiferrales bacterium]
MAASDTEALAHRIAELPLRDAARVLVWKVKQTRGVDLLPGFSFLVHLGGACDGLVERTSWARRQMFFDESHYTLFESQRVARDLARKLGTQLCRVGLNHAFQFGATFHFSTPLATPKLGRNLGAKQRFQRLFLAFQVGKGNRINET